MALALWAYYVAYWKARRAKHVSWLLYAEHRDAAHTHYPINNYSCIRCDTEKRYTANAINKFEIQKNKPVITNPWQIVGVAVVSALVIFVVIRSLAYWIFGV